MFIGHYGPAVADSQRGGAGVRLWEAFLAVQAIDIVHALLAIAGLEGFHYAGFDAPPVLHIPFSHSLVTAAGISLAAGALFRMLRPEAGARGGWTVAALAASHWPLDWVVHRPDLPLWPGSETVLGLGLWDHAWESYALEVVLLAGAMAWWVRATKGPRWTAGAAAALVAVMAALQFTFITRPTLLAQSGAMEEGAMPAGAVMGAMTLAAFLVLAGAVGLIERRRQAARLPSPQAAG